MKAPKSVAIIWGPVAVAVIIVATAIFFWPSPAVETWATGSWTATCTNTLITADCYKADGTTNHNVNFNAKLCGNGINNINGTLKCA